MLYCELLAVSCHFNLGEHNVQNIKIHQMSPLFPSVSLLVSICKLGWTFVNSARGF